VRQRGAKAPVLPSRVGGLLMADSLESSEVASAVMDLISAGGHVTLVERAARPEDVGRMPAEVIDSLVVRVLRDRQVLAFWQADARIRADDRLVVIRPVTP
jgi:voltage-gated potassium channel